MAALDYLLKPVEMERLGETVERAVKAVSTGERSATEQAVAPRGGQQRSKILVKSAGRSLIVDAQDIVYATIDEGIITVVTNTVEGESNYKTIEELQSNLDPDNFWRVHRSYLVNINKIREVIPWFKSSYQIRMDDKRGTEIPVSRVQTKRLRALLKL
jgi:two-component system LytT family response regulator/two-component system response regulator LytT